MAWCMCLTWFDQEASHVFIGQLQFVLKKKEEKEDKKDKDEEEEKKKEREEEEKQCMCFWLAVPGSQSNSMMHLPRVTAGWLPAIEFDRTPPSATDDSSDILFRVHLDERILRIFVWMES